MYPDKIRARFEMWEGIIKACTHITIKKIYNRNIYMLFWAGNIVRSGITVCLKRAS
jgi:hypothetical protein